MTNAVESKMLDHSFGDGVWTVGSPVYLALVTVPVVETDTAATITEAVYTGYARLPIAAADMSPAVNGSKTNANPLTFADCTAMPSGPQSIVGFAICSSASGAGDVIWYGTLPTVTISTTQTPATVAAGALVVTQD